MLLPRCAWGDMVCEGWKGTGGPLSRLSMHYQIYWPTWPLSVGDKRVNTLALLGLPSGILRAAKFCTAPLGPHAQD